MENLGRIVAINLGILALYSILLALGSGRDEGGIAFLLLMMFAVGVHVLINLILMIVYFARGNNPKGKVFLLSTCVVLIIGFATCWGVPFIIYK
jgi:hypothetical protein